MRSPDLDEREDDIITLCIQAKGTHKIEEDSESTNNTKKITRFPSGIFILAHNRVEIPLENIHYSHTNTWPLTCNK